MTKSTRLTSIGLFVAALAASSCSAHAKSDSPTSCNKADRHGTYLAEFAQQSGNCGPVASQLENLDDTTPIGDGCVITNKTWSNGDCETTGTVRCPGHPPGGGTITVTIVSRQETQDGSILDGTETININAPGGCTSTYSVRLTRQ